MFLEGSSTWGVIVSNVYSEDQSTNDVGVWLPNSLVAGGGLSITDFGIADAGTNVTEISGNFQSIGGLSGNPDGIYAPFTPIPSEAPAIVMGTNPAAYQAMTESPERYGNVGFFHGRVIGPTQASWRSFHPTAVRFTNLAAQDSTTWTGSDSITTTQVAAPDGTSLAGHVVTASSSPVGVFFYDSSIVLSAGDILIATCVLRSPNNGFCSDTPLTLRTTTSGVWFTSPSIRGGPFNSQGFGYYMIGEGQPWYSSVVFQVLSGGSATIQFYGAINSAYPLEFYAPMLLHIPAGTISLSEAAEIAAYQAPYPDTASAGDVSMLRGQRLSIGGSTAYFGKLTHANTADRIYTLPDAAGNLLANSGSGIGNGSDGNIQVPAVGTGTGPATPGTVSGFTKIIDPTLGTIWVPYMQ